MMLDESNTCASHNSKPCVRTTIRNLPTATRVSWLWQSSGSHFLFQHVIFLCECDTCVRTTFPVHSSSVCHIGSHPPHPHLQMAHSEVALPITMGAPLGQVVWNCCVRFAFVAILVLKCNKSPLSQKELLRSHGAMVFVNASWFRIYVHKHIYIYICSFRDWEFCTFAQTLQIKLAFWNLRQALHQYLE